ncbi:MAG TPA: hypothetical protein VGW96_06205, partial [Candidatus Eremiobacteraceae bacterium]|nr:hypothetical protein [Candidatus Eremiobacteraceae bacterium]
MNPLFPDARMWSRDELIAILGEPEREKMQISHSEIMADGSQSITPVEVNRGTIGAQRIMFWRCSPVPSDAEDVH